MISQRKGSSGYVFLPTRRFNSSPTINSMPSGINPLYGPARTRLSNQKNGRMAAVDDLQPFGVSTKPWDDSLQPLHLRQKKHCMTGETQSRDKVSAADTISIGFTEKAWEFKWGIQLVYVALYADTVLASFLHRNLLSLTLDSAQIWGAVGALLVAAAGLCLTVS